MLNPVLAIIHLILDIYSFAIFVYIVIALLIHFEIINKHQPLVARVMSFLAQIIEPVLNKIRRYLKPINGIDIAPLVLLLTIRFVQYCIVYYFAG